MAKIKIGFNRLNVPKQIIRLRLIIAALTGNASYATPSPTLAVLIAAADALEAAYNASRNRDKVKMEEMRMRRAELLSLVVQLAAYVQNASGGDAEVILSSGFEVVTRGSALPPVTQVQDVQVVSGTFSGSIKISWEPVKGARIYLVRVLIETEDQTALKLRATPSAARCIVTGLEPGVRYKITVAAIGGGEIGNWSNPAFKIAE